MSRRTVRREQHYYIHNKSYGLLHALFDITMTFLTGGLWLIWVLIRYLRTH